MIILIDQGNTVQQQFLKEEPKMKGFSRVYSSNNENHPISSYTNQQNFQLLSQQFPQFNLKKTTKTNYKPHENTLKAHSNNPLLANIKTQLNVLKDQMNKLFRKQTESNGIQNVKTNFNNTRATSQHKQNPKPISLTMNRQSLNFTKNTQQRKIGQMNKHNDTSNELYQFNSCILAKKVSKQTAAESTRYYHASPKENSHEQVSNRQENNKSKYEFYTGIDKNWRECQNLKRQNDFLRKTLESKNSEILTVNAELAKMKNQRWRMQRENIEMKNNLDESSKKINQLQTELSKYKMNAKDMEIHKDHLVRDLDYTKTQLNKSSIKISQLLKDSQKILNQNQVLKAQIQIQKNLKHKQFARDAQLQKQLIQKKDILKKKQQLISKLSQQVSFLRQDIHFMGDARIICDHLSQINANLNEDIILLNLKFLNQKFQAKAQTN